jgi:hypothetical protein
MALRNPSMRKYRFLKGFATGLALGVAATFIYHWDVGAAITQQVKYAFSRTPPVGAVDTSPATFAKLNHIACVGSEKDCGPAVVHTVPLPGTLWLMGVGLAGLCARKLQVVRHRL